MEKMVDHKQIFLNAYKGKRVLVTGHTGFKGSWLTAWLLELGAEVSGFSKYLPSDPCHFDVLKLKDRIKINVEADIQNLDALQRAFDEVQPEVVFHLAAQPLVRLSYAEPKLTFDTNMGGSVNVLECIKRSDSVEAVVMITSDKCYENVGWEWGYREDDILGGEDPYSASKACAEIMFRSYFRSFFQSNKNIQLATARAGNVIGGGDWAADRIVPDCVKAWSRKEIPVIRKPEATRPWQHVLEPLSGYLWLGAQLIKRGKNNLNGEAFNFGPGSEVIASVGDLVNTFSQHWDLAKWKHEPLEGDKKEANLLKLSCDKVLHRLAWRSALTFPETVEYTAQWYKTFYQKGDVSQLTYQQISDYTQLAMAKNYVWTGSDL